MTRPVVFLGPSLPVSEARAILDADYRAPAGQGDILRALADAPPAIGLIDGIFKNAPTVRHREILWAMGRGVPVFGASSMGALRAAELSAHGMIGVGLIYRWFRRYPLLPDDAVAVTHTPAELGARPLSAALVDIRRSLTAAHRAGALSPEAARALAGTATNTAFPDRQMPDAAQPHLVPQKARDARRLLQHMAACQARADWPQPGVEFPPVVHAWLTDLQDSGLKLDT